MKPKYFIKGSLNEDGTGVDFLHGNVFSELLEPWRDKSLSITLEVAYNRRSLRQNRYLYGVIIPCVGNWLLLTEGKRMSIDGIKMYIYTTVLGDKLNIEEILGTTVITLSGQRFSDMSTVEFNDAKTTVQEYFGPRGCDVPDPREQNFLNDYLN